MQSGQVSVWVPIIVGIIGVVGVLVGQLLSMWREQRDEVVRAQLERASDDRKNRRDDRLYWRDRRIEVGADFLVSLNVWRELTVDEWHEIAKDGQVGEPTREHLGETVTRVSDQLAHIRLIGTDAMSTTAQSAVSTLLQVSRATKRDLERQDRQMDLTSASDSLTAEIRASARCSAPSSACPRRTSPPRPARHDVDTFGRPIGTTSPLARSGRTASPRGAGSGKRMVRAGFRDKPVLISRERAGYQWTEGLLVSG